MLPETSPGVFSSMVCRVSGRVVFWSNRPVGVPSCPSLPRPAAPPCAAPPRPARGMFGFRILQTAKMLNLNTTRYFFIPQNNSRPGRFFEGASILNKYIGRTQNADIPRASRGGAAHGGAAGRGRVGQDGTPTDRSAEETTDHLAPQSSVDNCPGRPPGSTNKGIPI